MLMSLPSLGVRGTMPLEESPPLEVELVGLSRKSRPFGKRLARETRPETSKGSVDEEAIEGRDLGLLIPGSFSVLKPRGGRRFEGGLLGALIGPA